MTKVIVQGFCEVVDRKGSGFIYLLYNTIYSQPTCYIRDNHNPIIRNTHSPVSRSIHNPVSQNIYNPVSQNIYNPVSRNIHFQDLEPNFLVPNLVSA